MEVRGSLGMVASSNADAGHASNEHAVPTKLMGILNIEQWVLKLLEREDNWIHIDLTEYQQLELHRLSKKEKMDPDSGEWKALHHLTRFSFDVYQKNKKLSRYYTKVPVKEGEITIGHNITCKDGGPSTSILIHSGDRCPLSECVAMNNQCCHELAYDDGILC